MKIMFAGVDVAELAWAVRSPTVCPSLAPTFNPALVAWCWDRRLKNASANWLRPTLATQTKRIFIRHLPEVYPGGLSRNPIFALAIEPFSVTNKVTKSQQGPVNQRPALPG